MSREKGMVPAGKYLNTSFGWDLYEDNEGRIYSPIRKTLSEVIELAVTDGRTFYHINDSELSDEKERLDYTLECMEDREFTSSAWHESVADGHPEYVKFTTVLGK